MDHLARFAVLAALAFGVLLPTACWPGAPPDGEADAVVRRLGDLLGRIESAAGPLLIPSVDGDIVDFRAVGAGPGFWIRMELAPTAEDPVGWSWDGRPVPAEWLESASDAAILRPPPGVLTRDGPPLRATPPAGMELIDFGAALSYGVGEEARQLLDIVPAMRALGAQATRSLVGLGADSMRGGLLFEGPARLATEIRAPRAGEMIVDAQNLSGSEAEFEVETDSRRVSTLVPPDGRARLALPVEAGERLLRFQVRGDPDSLFFWGEPRWRFVRDPEEVTAVVLVVLDTIRRDALSQTLDGRSVAPTLDALRRQSTWFDSAWTTAPWTLPSHASLFTGLYPSRHGAGVAGPLLPAGPPTLAAALVDRGFYTVALGGGVFTRSRFGLGRGFHSHHDPEGGGAGAAELIDGAVSALDGATDHPVFLFLNLFDAHFPYWGPGQDGETSAAEMTRRWQRVSESGMEPPTALRDAAWRAYLEQLRTMDREIGRLFQELERRGLWSRSLVIVTSDHGELFGERGRYFHSYGLDPELLAIPLLVKWPGQETASEVAAPVSLVDLLPTILHTVGGEIPAGDGVVLGRTSVETDREAVFAEEHTQPRAHPLTGDAWIADHLYARITARDVEVAWPSGQRCWSRGPRDWDVVACEGPAHRLLAEMLATLSPAGSRSGVEIDDELRRQLRALGYLR